MSCESDLQDLPTGKKHVSFSEMAVWTGCSYRHKLAHVDKVPLEEVPSPFPEFGKALHSAVENYIKTRKMKVSIAHKHIKAAWKRDQLLDLESWLTQATDILKDVPKFLDETFPNWEYVEAEHMLYEKLEKYPHAFKGFIDAIIRVPVGKKTKKWKYWVIDWKTSSWGWKREKREDPVTQSQIVLYKNFWTEKTKTNPKDVMCGFVLLKRAAKPGQHCELVRVSAGPKTTQRSLQVVNNMIYSLNKGIAIKNKYACTWCEFKGTKFCPSSPCDV